MCFKKSEAGLTDHLFARTASSIGFVDVEEVGKPAFQSMPDTIVRAEICARTLELGGASFAFSQSHNFCLGIASGQSCVSSHFGDGVATRAFD